MRILKRISLLQIFLMFFTGIVSAQCTTLNFLNPSFEGPPQPHVCPPNWSNCNGTTSDTQPGSWGINAPPTNGNTYLGMVAVPGWQETASQFISGCLVPGQTYTFTVDLATQLDNSSGGNCTGNLVLWGGNAGVTSGSACDFNTQLWNSGTLASGALFSTYTISITPTQNFCSLTWQAMETPGCSAGTFSVQLDNISPIVPFSVTPSQTNVTCFGGTNGTATVTPPATGGPFTYVWSPAPGGGQGTPTATGLAAGTYTCTVTNAAGCVATQSFTITQPPSFTVNITNPGPITCGQNITLTANPSGGAGGNTFSWSPGGQNTASITVAPVVNTNYTVTVTDANGCTATATTTVVVNCGCSITSFTGNPINANCVTGLYDVSGQIQFTGQPVTGILTISGNCGGSQVFNAPFTSPINYNFTGLTANGAPCTVTAVFSGLPCSSTVNYTAPLTTLLDPTITPAGPFCDNAAATNLTAADPGGTWSGTGITNASAGTFDPAVAGPGLHTITYNIPGACGGTDTEQIQVNATADATITPSGPYCSLDPVVTLTAVDPGGTWSGNGITSGAAGTFDPGIAGAGTWTITYSIGGACGDLQTTNIVVTSQLDATITPAGPFCDNAAAINLTAADPGGTWSGTGITNAATGTFEPSVAGPGLHSVTYTIPGVCGGTDTKQIQVNASADATITPSGPYCILDPVVTLTAVDAGGTWSGNGITSGAAGTFDPGIAGAGTWTITYSIAGACGDLQTTNIVVNSQLNATISPAGPFCESNPATLLTAVDPGGTWSGPGITNATTGQFTPATAGPGTHTIQYLIPGGCGDTSTVQIQVIQDADATITPVGPYCVLDVPVTLTAADPGGVWSGTGITNAATGTFDPGVAGAGTHVITYTISGVCGDAQTTTITVVGQTLATINPVGPFCINANPLNLSAATPGGTWSGTGIVNATAGSFSPAAAGEGTHTITYITAGGCADTGTTNITVNPMPTVLFTGDTLIGCSPVCVDFSDLSTITSGNISQWSWDFGDGTISTTQDPSHCYTNPTFNTVTFDVTLTATSGNGCATTQVINNMVTVYANPDADFTFGPQPTTVMFPQIEFNNTSLGASTYLWTFDVYGTSTQQDPTFTFPDDTAGTYLVCLDASTANGCVENICHYVIIEEQFSLYVPNAFTPDGDGTNDIFIPVIKGYDIDRFELFVFDRWGEMVYYTKNAADGWDGTHKNVKAKSDVYVWKIKARDTHNERKSFYGHVSLLR